MPALQVLRARARKAYAVNRYAFEAERHRGIAIRPTRRYVYNVRPPPYGLEGHKHRIFGRALDQAVLFQLGNIGVDVEIVAFNGLARA